MMRLDKYLAERTGMTRSESRKAVTKGRVSIDGAVCRKADTQLDEHTAAVALDGVPLAGAYRKFVYIMLNKPEASSVPAVTKRTRRCRSGRGGLSAAGAVPRGAAGQDEHRLCAAD